MTLETRLVPVKLAKGVDTKRDPKQLALGRLTVLQNGVFQTPDLIRKRYGYTAFPQVISSGVGITTYQDELLLASGTNLYGYAQGTYVVRDSAQPQVRLTAAKSVFTGGDSAAQCDSAYHAGTGLQAFVWLDAVTLIWYYSIVDRATGTKVVPATSLGKTNQCVFKAAALGSYLLLVFYDGDIGNQIYWYAINTATPTVLPAATHIETDANSNGIFDIAVASSRIYIAYNTNVGGGSVKVEYWDSSLNFGASLSTTSDHANLITVFADASSQVWVGWYNGTKVRARSATATLSAYNFGSVDIATATATALTGAAPATTANFYYGVSGPAVRTNTVTSGGSAGSPTDTIRSLNIAGRAFVQNSNIYLLAQYANASVEQPTYFMLCTTQGSLVAAKLAPGTAPSTAVVGTSTVNAIDASTVQFAYLAAAAGNSVGVGLASLGVFTAEVSFAAALQTVDVAKTLHLASGVLWMYDSVKTCEHGFHIFPEGLTNVPSSSGGSIGAGSYNWVATYEWTDAQGQLHRSAASPVTSASFGSGTTNSCAVTIPTLRVTAKTGVQVVLWRTTANTSLHYKVSSTANDPTTDTVAITDTTVDSSLVANEPLYTNGTPGEVDNIAPPAPTAVFTYKDRVIVIPVETPCSWWFSKEIPPGTPVEFSDLLVQNETQDGGAFTCGAQMDDKLVLFKRDMPFVVVGNGPARDGTGNDFQPAQRIVADTGCSNAASLVLMKDGLMYQSPKGIYLLDRSLNDHYVGADVEGFLAGQTVTSAVALKGTTQVRFTLGNGTALVYDYQDALRDERGFGQWSVFTNVSAVGAVVFQGLYAYLKSNGVVMQENQSVFTDAGAFVALTLTTGWISLAGVQGFQRLRKLLILGDYKSAHTLRAQVAYDFDGTVVQTGNIAASSTPPYQYRLLLGRQKCEAIQLTIQDVQSSNFGEGLDISGFALEVGVKGTAKVPAAKSFG